MNKNRQTFRQSIGKSLPLSLVYCISFSLLFTLLIDLYIVQHYTVWTFVTGICIGVVLGWLLHIQAGKRNKEEEEDADQS